MTETISKPLQHYARNVKSQDGEDGIIERIFEIIGTKNKWCLELGALNGTHHSNSWNLINNHGWSATLIEADVSQFRKLSELYKNNSSIHPLNAFVSFEGDTSLDALLAQTPIPKDFDCMSLDIDGNDYYVWESMQQYRPRVVAIEFNQSIPNHITFIQAKDMSVFQGSSLWAVTELAKQKGYELVATTDSNAFFVLAELFGMFGISDNSLDALHTDTKSHTYLFQLYDGTIKIAGKQELIWHHVPITEEKLQVLSRRRYPAHIDQGVAVRRIKDRIRRLPGYSLLQSIRKLL